jgi:GntR family transcriptional regulator
MRLRVDPNSGVPLGVQIARGVRLAIAAGRLAAGDRLPSARELAADLGVNFHTVRKAYGELEAEGLLRVERGRGTTVAPDAKTLRAADLRALVRRHVERLAEDLAGADVDDERLRELVVEELRRALGARGRER